MIEAREFVGELIDNKLGPFIEVPCSILTPLINYMLDNDIRLETPANEAIAMGLAAGHYLATGKIPVVMMQNSGLCNAMNALTSLHGIYEIPVLLIVTWRGEPGKKDAPEHLIVGKKTEELLKVLNLPYKILTPKGFRTEIREIVEAIKETRCPGVLILRKGVIKEYQSARRDTGYPLTMREAIATIKEVAGEGVFYISTTGHISRISFSVGDHSDFYMLGSMGHALPIGLGVALGTDRKVVVLDGDGSCLMHAGAMASVGADKPKNLIHIVLDNEVHGSTGGQPSLSPKINFSKIARDFMYKNILTAKTETELRRAVEKAIEKDGSTFIHVKINRKTPPEEDMPRVSDTYTCSEIKDRFMKKF
jgi:phosphonopyruvate decarboxylase